ncbi:MAG TPA: di-heme oxidoredictase family protein, partial [Nitrospiria bacterium]|nr:di-heme oxidoredictase family protein [Nitrospiria bacterium]
GVVRLFGDLKRHDMGPGLAESIDEAGTGASVFLTRNLWGVGSTAPYMHDGRATTLTEAIIEHGGEGETAKQAFLALSTADQQDLVAFLNNLVLFKQPDTAAPATNTSTTVFQKKSFQR